MINSINDAKYEYLIMPLHYLHIYVIDTFTLLLLLACLHLFCKHIKNVIYLRKTSPTCLNCLHCFTVFTNLHVYIHVFTLLAY